MKYTLTLILGIAAIAMTCCTRTDHVPLESVSREYIHVDTGKFISQINSLKEQIRNHESQRESLIHREKETATVDENGDTIRYDHFIYVDLEREERSGYEHVIKSQRDSINDLRTQLSSVKTDSIQVPYPVERELTRWEKIKMDTGGIALGGMMTVSVVCAALAVWLIKIKRRR